ncbi:MAG: PilZ domain-containing protein [Phycisphaerales bacterium]|nr:MAG: PilZ domain-containing protein [Phycisphaerales bacterium]
MPRDSGLTVRQYEREDIHLSIEFVVAEKHRAQVQFSPMSAAADPHAVRGVASDLSSGGMGLELGQFIPRLCEGSVRVLDPRAVGERRDGTPVHEVAFEHPVKVRRVTMTDHEPTYAVGVSFIDPAPDAQRKLQDLLARAPGPDCAPAGGGAADA